MLENSYAIKGFDAFYGFFAGLFAGNYDITEVFVDATFKVGGCPMLENRMAFKHGSSNTASDDILVDTLGQVLLIAGLIGMVNDALKTSKGNVVCVEKGDTLKFGLSYQARLIDIDHYAIKGGNRDFLRKSGKPFRWF